MHGELATAGRQAEAKQEMQGGRMSIKVLEEQDGVGNAPLQMFCSRRPSVEWGMG